MVSTPPKPQMTSLPIVPLNVLSLELPFMVQVVGSVSEDALTATFTVAAWPGGSARITQIGDFFGGLRAARQRYRT
jgi:hypothetical protein